MQMKKLIIPIAMALVTLFVTSGCVAAIGNRDGQKGNITLGQQLVDLKKAHECGAISDAEYETQKAKLLK
jgi:hypothetical protein